MKLKIISAFVLLGGFSFSAMAQCGNGIPSAGNPGCIPPDQSNSPYYQGGGRGSAPSPQPRAVWSDRWGAIALNEKTGEWGTAENEKNKSRAERAAVADCSARTTEGCEVFLSYHNQCVAFASGNGGGGASGSPTIEDASERAISRCSSAGGTGCRVLYSACSIPVRIQ